jgi:hypothetical protein
VVQWDLAAVTQTQYVLEAVQIQPEYVGLEIAEHRVACVLKVEQVVEVFVQQALRYIAVLPPTATVLAVRTMITAAQSVTTLVVFGLPVPTVAILIAVADSRVRHS